MDKILKNQFIGTIIAGIILIILGVAWAFIGILCLIKTWTNVTVWTYWDLISLVWSIMSLSGVCWIIWWGSK